MYANFYSIDPTTDLPPSVDIGFLPPEDGTGRGQGFIAYTVEQIPGLTTGTEIRNIAYITFDGAETIATNQVDPHDHTKGVDPEKEALNTIDAGIPTSSVKTLPLESANRFVVSWSGQDDTGGSGIGSYDIYSSEDNNDFQLWLNDTTETSALFTGDLNRTYSFYSIATDNVGHQEIKIQITEAITQVTSIVSELSNTPSPTLIPTPQQFTPTPTMIFTPPVTESPTTTPTPTATPLSSEEGQVIVYDDESFSEYFSNKTDFDDVENRLLVIHWRYTGPLSIIDWHVYVKKNDGGYFYLGNTGTWRSASIMYGEIQMLTHSINSVYGEFIRIMKEIVSSY